MKLQFFKKAALLGFTSLLIACASPMISASPHNRDVARIAALMANEVSPTHVESLDLLDLSRTIVRLSRTYAIDPLLVLAIIKVESGFKPTARSHAGAIGLMQVMPIVIRAVGDEVSVYSRDDLYDPYKNILLGIHYFTFLRDKYRNNVQNALVAYNMGPTALDGLLVRRNFVPVGYSQKVMRAYEQFRKRMLALIDIAEFT